MIKLYLFGEDSGSHVFGASSLLWGGGGRCGIAWEALPIDCLAKGLIVIPDEFRRPVEPVGGDIVTAGADVVDKECCCWWWGCCC